MENSNTKSVTKPQSTTVWSFPKRGDWATHNPKYRGNFAPQIPRNIIEMYSQKGDTVLDPMVGGGTTLIETKLLGRKGIGMDINPRAVELTDRALRFESPRAYSQEIRLGDARDLSPIADASVDLVVTHPPYMNIISYSERKIPGDLSNITSLPKFADQMEIIAAQLHRVLKPNGHCAILIGDTRRRKHYVPLAFNTARRFLRVGFALKEDIIKIQHNCKMSGKWRSKAAKSGFYLIAHEHLFVFRKPAPDENLSAIRYSLAP